jgi:hypothetical protein
MTDQLRVRVYNVRFGDAILISVPDRDGNGGTETRHILIDVGNMPGGEGGEDFVFAPVVEDIARELDGKPVDLYVMTHEHFDHVQGLLAASRGDPPLEVKAAYAWLTASSEPGYYEAFPNAKKRKLAFDGEFEAVERYVSALSAEELHPWVQALFLNNNPRKTSDYVDYLRQLAPDENTTYVYRGCDLAAKHPFREAKLEVWAPEQDTAAYRCRLRPLALSVTPPEGRKKRAELTAVKPPPGVDAEAFYNLVEMRRNGFFDNLLSIDAAGNNTSVVFSLDWRGWRLLFAGDAEAKSWRMMAKKGVLKPVDFLKVSHHGSANGLPEAEILERIMPAASPANRRRVAVVSTYEGTYGGVPARKLLETELACRCDDLSYIETPQVPDGAYVDFTFEG